MFWNFNKKQEPEILLALDIGTEYVKALAFSLSPEENKIEVKAMAKEKQNPQNMAGGMITDIKGASETCGRTLRKLENLLKVKLHKAIVGVAGESIQGGVATVHYERSKASEKITQAEIKNIIQKVQWKAFENFRKNFAEEAGLTEANIRIVDAQILKVKIDGFEVKNPVDFQGKNITFEIFNSIAPMTHLSSILGVVKNLGLKIERIAAEPCSIANLVCSGKNAPARSIFIDIGGGTTDIAIVRDGAIDGVRMFSMGGRALSNRISESFGVGNVEAEDIKIKYSSGKLSSDTTKLIGNILREDMEIWIKGVKIALEKFLRNKFFPETIYLCGGGCLVPEIKQTIKNVFLEKEKFNADVQYLYPGAFSDILEDKFNILTDTSDMASLGLAGLAKISRNENDFVGQALKRAVRIMQAF